MHTCYCAKHCGKIKVVRCGPHSQGAYVGRGQLSLRNNLFRTSLVVQWLSVQWLRLRLPVQGMWVWSLNWELICPIFMAKKTQNINQKQYRNKFNKDFKKVQVKKFLRKEQFVLGKVLIMHAHTHTHTHTHIQTHKSWGNFKKLSADLCGCS